MLNRWSLLLLLLAIIGCTSGPALCPVGDYTVDLAFTSGDCGLDHACATFTIDEECMDDTVAFTGHKVNASGVGFSWHETFTFQTPTSGVGDLALDFDAGGSCSQAFTFTLDAPTSP